MGERQEILGYLEVSAFSYMTWETAKQACVLVNCFGKGVEYVSCQKTLVYLYTNASAAACEYII